VYLGTNDSILLEESRIIGNSKSIRQRSVFTVSPMERIGDNKRGNEDDQKSQKDYAM
jgi:hypothetical protein